mmetsp:Transcript_114909/g.246950  ORF Transcript_114909/g.246950 Transcript_114909/m.246950 type:complete len:208 (-) Transcript_114909:44-667(-)
MAPRAPTADCGGRCCDGAMPAQQRHDARQPRGRAGRGHAPTVPRLPPHAQWPCPPMPVPAPFRGASRGSRFGAVSPAGRRARQAPRSRRARSGPRLRRGALPVAKRPARPFAAGAPRAPTQRPCPTTGRRWSAAAGQKPPEAPTPTWPPSTRRSRATRPRGEAARAATWPGNPRWTRPWLWPPPPQPLGEHERASRAGSAAARRRSA